MILPNIRWYQVVSGGIRWYQEISHVFIGSTWVNPQNIYNSQKKYILISCRFFGQLNQKFYCKVNFEQNPENSESEVSIHKFQMFLSKLLIQLFKFKFNFCKLCKKGLQSFEAALE